MGIHEKARVSAMIVRTVLIKKNAIHVFIGNKEQGDIDDEDHITGHIRMNAKKLRREHIPNLGNTRHAPHVQLYRSDKNIQPDAIQSGAENTGNIATGRFPFDFFQNRLVHVRLLCNPAVYTLYYNGNLTI